MITGNKKQREDEEGGNSPELKPLMGGETDGKLPTEETETVNNVDEFRGEPGQTEPDEETLQQEANNAQCADSEGTELQFTVREVQRDQPFAGQTENGLDKSQDKTEIKPVKARDDPNPPKNDPNNIEDENKTTSDNTEKLQEGQTEDNQQTEKEGEREEEQEEEATLKCAADERGAQSLTEEDKHGEQQTAERETLRDREKENLKNKLKTKERELEKTEGHISRFEGQMKDKEKQINEVKQQLEKMVRQTETEREMRSENTDDLKKEEELQKQLKKLETQLEGIKKDDIIMRQKKLKATNEKEDIIMKLNELEMQNNRSDPVYSL